jgi:hypothetical protein
MQRGSAVSVIDTKVARAGSHLLPAGELQPREPEPLAIGTSVYARRLRAVRLLHMTVWAVFAGSVVAIPWLTWQGPFGAD